MGHVGSQTPTIPLPSAPRLQPEVAIGMGPHLEGIKDIPCSQMLPGPRPGGAMGHGGLAVMAERWVTPPSQHPGGFCHPQLTAQPGPGSGWVRVPISSCQHSPVLPSGTLTFAEAICGEQGGHWKRRGWWLAPAPHAARGTHNPMAPTTPRPLPHSPGHPKPTGLTQQYLSPPALGYPWAQGDARGAEGKSQETVAPLPCPRGGKESAGLALGSP